MGIRALLDDLAASVLDTSTGLAVTVRYHVGGAAEYEELPGVVELDPVPRRDTDGDRVGVRQALVTVSARAVSQGDQVSLQETTGGAWVVYNVVEQARRDAGTITVRCARTDQVLSGPRRRVSA